MCNFDLKKNKLTTLFFTIYEIHSHLLIFRYFGQRENDTFL